MTAFILPDLGEGLKDADLVEWLVKEGQSVKVDELVLLVETAKAVVELPAPSAGIITRLAVAEGETVKVGQVLFEYEEKQNVDKLYKFSDSKEMNKDSSEPKESFSVVGELSQTRDEQTNLYEMEPIAELDHANLNATSVTSNNTAAKKIEYCSKQNNKTDPVCIAAFKESKAKKSKSGNKRTDSISTSYITPKIMAFAKHLGLQEIFNETNFEKITLHDLLNIYQEKLSQTKLIKPAQDDSILLSGARKVMAQVMTKAHQEIPSATIFEDAVITHWNEKTDITLKLINAIRKACLRVPLLNAWYDAENLMIKQHKDIDLGLAVNSERGLFVPVIRKINTKTANQIRSDINDFRMQINEQMILAKDLVGATISLSNFGVLSGRYATPIIVPPQVCIIGVGKSREEALVKNGKIQVGKILPISLSFDHRVATGAEAALFMQRMIEALEA